MKTTEKIIADAITTKYWSDITRIIDSRVRSALARRGVELPPFEIDELIDDATCQVATIMPDVVHRELGNETDAKQIAVSTARFAARNVLDGHRFVPNYRQNLPIDRSIDALGHLDKQFQRRDYHGPDLEDLLSVLSDNHKAIAMALAVGFSKQDIAKQLNVHRNRVGVSCGRIKSELSRRFKDFARAEN
jgi:hypothetical protein